MGLERIGPNRYSYDVHVWGIAERPRGIFDGTIHKARAFVVAETARLKKRSLTFSIVGEVLNTYLRERYQNTARYKESDRPFKDVMTGIGHYPLSVFRAMDLIAWTEKYRATHRPDTVNGVIMIAKSAFNWVRKYHGYQENPLVNVRYLKPENRQLWVYSPENIRAILDAARGGPYYPLFLALQYWPCRRGEVLGIRGSDIFPRFVRLPDQSNKTKLGRTLPMPDDAEIRGYLAAVPRDCPHAFCTERKSGIGRAEIAGRNVLRWLKAHKEALGLPGATLHGFRRTAAVRLDELGVSMAVIAELTGHKDLRTLSERYLPVSQRRKESAIEALVYSVRHGQNMDNTEKKQAAA